MELTLLTVPACPHRELFERRLLQALDGRDAAIVRHEIDDQAEADRYGLRGSPTLLVDGVDPFASPGEPVGVACRLYHLPDGSVQGAPTVEQLRTALGTCAPRSLFGWSPPPRAADSALKRAADRFLPRTGLPVIAFNCGVIALLVLAGALPVRGALIVETVAAFAAGTWCMVNFWRCRHAHCIVSGAGWLGLAVFTAIEAGLGRSLIGGYEQPVFVGILVLSLVFETAWYAVRHTNAVEFGDRRSPSC